jgi:hypothetical protein
MNRLEVVKLFLELLEALFGKDQLLIVHVVFPFESPKGYEKDVRVAHADTRDSPQPPCRTFRRAASAGRAAPSNRTVIGYRRRL